MIYEGLTVKSLAQAAIFILICALVLTRIFSGFQSLSGKTRDSEYLRRPRIVPYWIPWLGHGISFARDHINFLEKAK